MRTHPVSERPRLPPPRPRAACDHLPSCRPVPAATQPRGPILVPDDLSGAGVCVSLGPMCGRYAAASGVDDLVEEFEVDEDRSAEPTRTLLASPQAPPPGAPDFNLAPTKLAPIILTRRPHGATLGATARQVRLMTWGLVPSWSKDPRSGVRMINARSETAATSAAFGRALASRRALVPATGWYEWQASPTVRDARGKPRRQPFFIQRTDGRQLAFAGLYEFWRDPAVADTDDPEAWLTSFTILTTAAESGLDRIHDRQPLVLESAQWTRWLDPDRGVAEVADLLAPGVRGRFGAYPVGAAVGSNRHNGPGLIEPARPEDLRGVVDPVTGELIDG